MNIQRKTHSVDGSPMVLIPSGPFLMGLPESDFLAGDAEQPQRTVHLHSFWMDVYPVTNARFAQFLQAGGYDEPSFWAPEGWAWRLAAKVKVPAMWKVSGWNADEQPVAGVSWYEADAYARWSGKRLPTDAEWEKAARGTDGRRYPWGDDWPARNLANFNNFVGRTTPVGSYPEGVSPFGCFDMAGNVNNWTADWYWEAWGKYCSIRMFDRQPFLGDQIRASLQEKLQSIDEKVDRGGGYATDRSCQEVLSCTFQLHWKPETRESWHGFRTACDAKSE